MGLFERLRSEPVYNTRAVVRQTGVPADTFRSWERRHGFPAPARTDGNQRRYSERDIAAIAWLRDQTQAGMTIGQAIAHLRTLEPHVTGATVATAVARPVVSPNGAYPDALRQRMAHLRDVMVDALVAFDAAVADRAVEEALALLPLEEVCLNLMQPVLVEIGERWARGEVGVSVEHFASGFVIRKVGALFNLSRPDTGRGPLVAACLEGELHEVGLLLTCLFLSRRGFAIVYLGPNLPLRDLAQAVARVRAPLVLLSAATPPAAEQLIHASHELARLLPRQGEHPTPMIGFGGAAFIADPSLGERVNGVFLGTDAESASQTVERVLAAS
ncbi:MAG: hypothetical protein AVDCRST_MAG73-2778 [uncultured Thermomicrobiales bacterium]|uniref:Transcriptional regulator, MerR family n=1 Tax=uncultured Thermomicrobiales bacterium TaxID=1645740 RepID=A0A6J4UJZ9_9BACT|nr:MAG: hypothetical protein AVDCRST_MAG73-2778 [uncultured Thermomicrobiales bacterium]